MYILSCTDRLFRCIITRQCGYTHAHAHTHTHTHTYIYLSIYIYMRVYVCMYVSSHTEDLWYNETVSRWMTIYIYIYISYLSKKKRTCCRIDLAIPADHNMKNKENEKWDKYLNHARIKKKQLNIKVTMMPIVIGALGGSSKGLIRKVIRLEIGGRIETIQITALLKSARILRRVLETWEYLLSDFRGRLSAKACVKNFLGVKW